MAVGCAVESWQIAVASGPGRANSKITIEFVGSGKLTEPSGITLPAAVVEKLLPSASLALTINGTNYVTNKNIISLEFGGKNNIRLDDGFYPGSGFQTPADSTSGAIRGRMEYGTFDAIFTKDHVAGESVRPTIWPTPILREGDDLAFDILSVASPDPGSDLTVAIQT
jgi:hypothetical protein